MLLLPARESSGKDSPLPPESSGGKNSNENVGDPAWIMSLICMAQSERSFLLLPVNLIIAMARSHFEQALLVRPALFVGGDQFLEARIVAEAVPGRVEAQPGWGDHGPIGG